MPKSNELKLEGCAPTEAVAECCWEEKKGGRIHAEDGIQSRSERPSLLQPTGLSGGTACADGSFAFRPERRPLHHFSTPNNRLIERCRVNSRRIPCSFPVQ